MKQSNDTTTPDISADESDVLSLGESLEHPEVGQQVLAFRKRAFQIIGRVYMGLCGLELLIVIAYSLFVRPMKSELLMVGGGFFGILGILWLARSKEALARRVFFVLISLIQVFGVLALSWPYALTFLAASGCLVCIIFALLETPKRAFWGTIATSFSIGLVFFLRGTFYPQQFPVFPPNTVVLISFVSFIFTVTIAVLTRWMTQGFIAALMMSQAMSERLAETNSDLAKARDEALMASRAKSSFLANMSHELRTPLNAILGYSELLQEELEEEGVLSTQVHDDIQSIQRSGLHLLGLIGDVLDLAKIEANTLHIQFAQVDPRELCDSVEKAVKPLAKQRNNRLKSVVEDDIGMFSTDPGRLQQILLNLLSNACKFTENGEIEIQASMVSRGGQEFLRFCVSDTGIGIQPGRLEQLLEAFEQADNTSTRAYGGSGLGLTITHKMTRLLGGHLEVESQPGIGSSFTVELPRAPLTETPAPIGIKTTIQAVQ